MPRTTVALGASDEECREREEEFFGNGIDVVDEAMGAISMWLKEQDDVENS